MLSKELRTVNFSISMQKQFTDRLDKLVEYYRQEGLNTSRSSLIQSAVKDFLDSVEKKINERESNK